MKNSIFLLNESESDVAKYGDPYSEFVLCIYPIQSAHTHREHTHTHTRSSGQPFMQQCMPVDTLTKCTQAGKCF